MPSQPNPQARRRWPLSQATARAGGRERRPSPNRCSSSGSAKPGGDSVPTIDASPLKSGRSSTAFALATAIVLAGSLGTSAKAQTAAELAPSGSAAEIRAQLVPRNFTILSSEVAARIDRIATRVGEHFKQGDVLIAFDCVAQRAQVVRARAVATQAEKTAAINQRLAALKSIGQLELDISRAEVEKARADLVIADAAASKCTIAAPFSGITVEQKAQQFQYATPGQPLLEILDDKTLEVELIAPSRWLAWLKPGYAFKLHIEEVDKAYGAQITRVGGRVDPVSQTIKVFGIVNGDASELMAGMSGRAYIAQP
ncbi:efflux RND transporter periplasmic adaptor subunit [Bosea sp. 685]|uniref:efflux RND transporter periplasmic adaptor subunit n=1 Tax=Bosea sp. 685 TaxID=3080057 RepID=UPI00289375F9|nr:efflux RND transporter periplasmic adaptor subunit [Bosea sp. 685]WNJ91574.1 efflux RND transporter periplasmic adaptor subunit [Bosea sp. 685]